MKYFLLIAITVSFSLCAVAQSTISVRTKVNTALGVQQGKLRNVYGIGGLYETPLKKESPFKFTAGLDFGINGIKSMPYELRFNGSLTNTNINYTSYVIQLASGLRYIVREDKGWTPYVGVSAGILNYYTSLSIEDPSQPDGCTALETKPVSYSMVLAGTTEAGIRVRPKQKGRGSVSYIEAGAAFISGTKGKYLRLENVDEHNHSEDSYMIKFRQNSTGMEHEHRMGTMHRTTTSQLALHLALMFRL